MTTIEEIKRQLILAEKEISEPENIHHDVARQIVNIERQAFYGDDSSTIRLAKIRGLLNKTYLKE